MFSKREVYVFNIVTPLILIAILGLCISVVSNHTLFNSFKDTIYFIKPISAIIFGYLLFSLIETKRAYKILIVIGVIFALFHIYNVFALEELHSLSIHHIRNNAGLNNFIEMISILLLLILKKNKLYFFSKLKTKIFFGILLVSFILYFSRTMVFALVIMYLFAMGYHRLSGKGVIMLCSIILLLILFYWYLFSIELNINAIGLEGFLYKMRMAPSEIFYTANLNVKNLSLKDLRYLYDHWRGYEASSALNQLQGINLFLGNGFGALVDLGFETQLGGEKIRYIPILHNGYIYVLFKTGILGLLFYLFFFYKLFSKLNKKYVNPELNGTASLALALTVFYVLSSFVITGIYNQGDLITFIFGGVLCMHKTLLKNI